MDQFISSGLWTRFTQAPTWRRGLDAPSGADALADAGGRRVAFESAHQSIAPSTEPSRASSPQSRTRADLFAVAGGVPDVAVDGVKGSWATCPSELANDDSSMVAPSPSAGSSRDRRAAGQAAPSQPLRGRSDMAPMQQEMERPGRRRSRDRSPSLGQSSAASFSGDSSIVDSEDSTGGRAKTEDAAAVAAARQNARGPA